MKVSLFCFGPPSAGARELNTASVLQVFREVPGALSTFMYICYTRGNQIIYHSSKRFRLRRGCSTMKNKARDECLLDACPRPGYIRGCAVKPLLDNSSIGICLRHGVIAPICLEVRLDSYSRMHVQHELDYLFRAEHNHIPSIAPSEADNAILQARQALTRLPVSTKKRAHLLRNTMGTTC